MGSGGRPCRAAAAEERNVEAASCGAALPSPLPGTASASTGAAASAAPSLANQSRWMLVASSFTISVTASASLWLICFLIPKIRKSNKK